jgi:hypothetical protein
MEYSLIEYSRTEYSRTEYSVQNIQSYRVYKFQEFIEHQNLFSFNENKAHNSKHKYFEKLNNFNRIDLKLNFNFLSYCFLSYIKYYLNLILM